MSRRAAVAAVALVAALLPVASPALAQSPENRVTPFSDLFNYDPAERQITAKRKIQVGGYRLEPGVAKSCKDLKDGDDDVCAWSGKDLEVEQNGPLTVVKGPAG